MPRHQQSIPAEEPSKKSYPLPKRAKILFTVWFTVALSCLALLIIGTMVG